MSKGLRVILFDRTCIRRWGLGLSRAWSHGAKLYALLGRSDAAYGAESFADAWSWLAKFRAERAIDEVQFWGHGKWGRLFVERDVLDRSALAPGHPHHGSLLAIRERLAPGARFWFRTCETFGATAGHDFARAWTDFFGSPAAGHTFIIGYWQSGLHLLRPGAAPHWAADEGLLRGSPSRPERAAWSSPRKPYTISCLTGRVPDGW